MDGFIETRGIGNRVRRVEDVEHNSPLSKFNRGIFKKVVQKDLTRGRDQQLFRRIENESASLTSSNSKPLLSYRVLQRVSAKEGTA